jgi:hypothetical protein
MIVEAGGWTFSSIPSSARTTSATGWGSPETRSSGGPPREPGLEARLELPLNYLQTSERVA